MVLSLPEVSENDCILVIEAYGYTRPAYSINQKTGLANIIIMPDELQGFLSESITLQLAELDQVKINKKWLDVPAKASLQAQRFLKYTLSHNWQPKPF